LVGVNKDSIYISNLNNELLVFNFSHLKKIRFRQDGRSRENLASGGTKIVGYAAIGLGAAFAGATLTSDGEFQSGDEDRTFEQVAIGAVIIGVGYLIQDLGESMKTTSNKTIRLRGDWFIEQVHQDQGSNTN
tara:strand:+ start:1373 stop:1768 length:396 start_codon:yes stop_codon:yes gene_type:complete